MSSGSSARTKQAAARGKSGLVRFSLNELKELHAAGKIRPPEPDAPEIDDLPDDFWDNAAVRYPNGKSSIHLRVDSDILDFFRAQGPGHLTRMNAVLRSYVDSQAKLAAKKR